MSDRPEPGRSIDPSELVARLVAIEPEAAARPQDIVIVRAPGRVDLIGKHTGYNEGHVLPAAIDRETTSPSCEPTVRTSGSPASRR